MGCPFRDIARSGLAGDQASAAFEGQVIPQPAEADGEAVAKSDEKIDMGHRPEDPGGEARDLQPPEGDDRPAAADGGQLSLAGWLEDRWFTTGEARADDARDVPALR